MRILVVDDHTLFRDGLVSLLETAGFNVVGQAGGGEEALEQARSLKPDLVLLDINMPDHSGLSILKRLKADNPQTFIVILTVSDNDEDLFKAVKSGASGYLLKNLPAEEFLEMLTGLKDGKAAITRETAARLMAGFAQAGDQAPAPPTDLTPRELELLQLVSEGLENKKIAQRLSISENTVKYHVRQILQKLGVQNRTEAVSRAMRNGLLPSYPTNS